MNYELSEISRLLDIMPASGRMMTKIVGKADQTTIVQTTFPVPWKNDRVIYLNFDLWMNLPNFFHIQKLEHQLLWLNCTGMGTNHRLLQRFFWQEV